MRLATLMMSLFLSGLFSIMAVFSPDEGNSQDHAMVCTACHASIATGFMSGPHGKIDLACTLCHVWAMEHSKSPTGIKPQVDKDICVICHAGKTESLKEVLRQEKRGHP